jgi:beta-aspartyl-peptidase (threonine type)
LDAGSTILRAGGSAVDAVVAAVVQLEDEVLFNAGVGSVLTADGRHELDAGVMRGSDAQAGSVAALQHIEHPVRLAQLVMTRSPHVLMVGEGAEEFARAQGMPMVANSTFTTPARLQIHHELLEQARRAHAQALTHGPTEEATLTAPSAAWAAPTSSPGPPFSLKPVLDHAEAGRGAGRVPEPSADPAQAGEMHAAMGSVPPSEVAASGAAAAAALAEGSLKEKKYGTVGAVALDMSGELATAISTGGMSLKSFGRVGDSALIGCGFYASKRCAVACTGHGEAFMRAAVAKDLDALLAYSSEGLTLQQAADRAMRNGEALCGKDVFEGGLIAVDKKGNIAST